MFGVDEESKKQLLEDIKKRLKEQKQRNKKRAKSFIRSSFIDFRVMKDKTDDEIMDEINDRIRYDKTLTFN